MERSAFHGTWWVRQAGERLVAFDLATKEEVELRGAMVQAVRAGGSAVRTLSPVMDRLTEALESSSRPGTVSELLAPSGFGLLFLELTGRCNEQCVHCYASSGPDVTESLDLETIEEVISDAHSLGFRSIQLTGGDPLISPHLMPAAELARALGLGVEVYTNGLALRGDLVKRLAALPVKMAFSFYSQDPGIHDAVTRTPGSQARTLAAILLAVDHGISVRVGLIATADNARDIDATWEYLTQRGVPEEALAVSRERSVGRGVFRGEDSTRERGRAHSSERSELAKLSVTYQGKVVPCIFDRHTVLGDIRRARLRDIVRREVPDLSGQGRRLRPVVNELSCQDCQFRRRLLGG